MYNGNGNSWRTHYHSDGSFELNTCKTKTTINVIPNPCPVKLLTINWAHKSSYPNSSFTGKKDIMCALVENEQKIFR